MVRLVHPAEPVPQGQQGSWDNVVMADPIARPVMSYRQAVGGRVVVAEAVARAVVAAAVDPAAAVEALVEAFFTTQAGPAPMAMRPATTEASEVPAPMAKVAASVVLVEPAEREARVEER